MIPLWLYLLVVAVAIGVGVIVGADRPGTCFACGRQLAPEDGELCIECYAGTYGGLR